MPRVQRDHGFGAASVVRELGDRAFRVRLPRETAQRVPHAAAQPCGGYALIPDFLRNFALSAEQVALGTLNQVWFLVASP